MIRSKLDVAEMVKNACIEAARNGFRDASVSGLCTDGAIEAAISAIQKLDVEKIVKKQSGT
ncbi:MAG: acetyltransferase [Balneolaceae bacterium]|nr:acetyltransferase [Balneolaceae bacterium]